MLLHWLSVHPLRGSILPNPHGLFLTINHKGRESYNRESIYYFMYITWCVASLKPNISVYMITYRLHWDTPSVNCMALVYSGSGILFSDAALPPAAQNDSPPAALLSSNRFARWYANQLMIIWMQRGIFHWDTYWYEKKDWSDRIGNEYQIPWSETLNKDHDCDGGAP